MTVTYSGVLAGRWAALLRNSTVAKTGVRLGRQKVKLRTALESLVGKADLVSLAPRTWLHPPWSCVAWGLSLGSTQLAFTACTQPALSWLCPEDVTK